MNDIRSFNFLSCTEILKNEIIKGARGFCFCILAASSVLTFNSAVAATAGDDSVTVISETSTTVDVLANDTGIGSLTLHAHGGWSQEGGTVSVLNNKLTYLSKVGFTGIDYIWYTFEDSLGYSNFGTVTVDVTSGNYSYPVGVTDDETATTGVQTTFDVLANDTGNGLTLVPLGNNNLAWSSEEGTYFLANNQLVYTSKAGFTGLDNIWYTFADSQGNTNYARVDITVTSGGYSYPIGVTDHEAATTGVQATFDVLANDTGNSLTLVPLGNNNLAWSLEGGTYFLANNQLVYTSKAGFTGLDNIWYTFADSQGNTNFAQVNIDVTSPNSWYKPTPGTTWQWQIDGPLNTGYNVDVYDIDLFGNDPSVIQQLQASGKKVICYFSTQYETGRPDSGDFPPSIIGSDLEYWPGEKWVNIRSSIVRDIMVNRLQLAKDKGCDGVEPDNVDGYVFDSDSDIENNTGFSITINDQLDYNIFLATTAHNLGLSVGLKNAVELIPQLEPYYDFAVNEQCNQYHECDALQPFIDNNKAVFQAEYYHVNADNTYRIIVVDDEGIETVITEADVCASANPAGRSALILDFDLNDISGPGRYSCL